MQSYEFAENFSHLANTLQVIVAAAAAVAERFQLTYVVMFARAC